MGAYTGSPLLNSSYELGDRFGKSIGVVRNLTLTISSQGSVTNYINALSLGIAAGSIQKVVFVNFTDTAPQNRALFVWTDGNLLLLGDPQASTDAARGEPIDLSGTLTVEVTGRPV